jgi:hypothetical protein
MGALSPERVRALPLAPVDGFILSRIDGSLTVGDLVQLTGVPHETLSTSLEKLAKLGVVSLGDETRARTPERSSSRDFGRESGRDADTRDKREGPIRRVTPIPRESPPPPPPPTPPQPPPAPPPQPPPQPQAMRPRRGPPPLDRVDRRA